MHFTALTFTALVAIFAAPTLGNKINIMNWCSQDVTAWQSHNGDCDHGENGICSGRPGSAPFVIPANQHSIGIDLISDGAGSSIKMTFANGDSHTPLQYEYTIAGGNIYWDLSAIDSENVKVTPTGNGVGQGSCTAIKCPANQFCGDAYNKPEDTKTKACPVDTGDMWVDLCMPTQSFKRQSPRDFTF
ncbi:Secreted thaumatin-like protein cetA [Lachnellula hyalina]|uniref:Secreted thaumatin-like protein cetA n=1 Tax=Lachnellula hyalina TaxID=1316788 RepID=A0A8H8U0D8_9HELO|nr:Secreted thaumatin-like protein cetA [Lachnellula hyalina]TVY27235.1 Secreted thaumatin-like protein cetA [Lachnellula hyalina]